MPLAKFANAKSSFPSLLKSPAMSELGPLPLALPVPRLGWTLNVPSPFPSIIVTVLSPLFAMARSSFPSPSKSAAISPLELVPVG